MGRVDIGTGLPFAVVSVTVIILVVAQTAQSGTTWKVGGNQGWTLGVDFSLWVQNKTFRNGDTLLFVYDKTQENVLEVLESDYQTCTTARPILMLTNGNSSVVLDNGSAFFFISGIPGYCLEGMTLNISISSNSSTNTTSPLPSPSPSPSPAPSLSVAPAPSGNSNSQTPAQENPNVSFSPIFSPSPAASNAYYTIPTFINFIFVISFLVKSTLLCWHFFQSANGKQMGFLTMSSR